MRKSTNSGFTLIEILVVMGIIAVLAAIVLIAINPSRQFQQSRNTQRSSNVNAILNAVSQNMADNKGNFVCGTALPAAATVIGKTTLDIRACLVPTYIAELPYDPSTGSAYDSGTGAYNTGYSILKDATTGRITVSAAGEPDAIVVTR